MQIKTKHTNNPLTFGLAMVGGIGLIAMIFSLGIGVVSGDDANAGAIGGLFLVGLVMLISGIVGWFVVVQPQKHFDDIDVAQDGGHGHGAHDVHGEVTAMTTVPVNAHIVEPISDQPHVVAAVKH